MTRLLTISSRPDSSPGCLLDPTSAAFADRVARFHRLLARALRGVATTGTTTTLRLADHPGVRQEACDLAEQEARCCPALATVVEVRGGDTTEIVWTLTGLGAAERAALAALVEAARPSEDASPVSAPPTPATG